MTTRLQRARGRFAALLLAAGGLALAFSALPALAVTTAPAANAAGDVCDICSVNFDLGACEKLGGYPYDSTLEEPPPAIKNGGTKPSSPAPANPAPAPAPAQPAPAPAPAAPAQPTAPQGNGSSSSGSTGGTSNGGSGGSASAPQSTEAPAEQPAASAPSAPTEFAHLVDGREITFTWAAPADGGSPITAFKLVLNGGTPVEIAADQLQYVITLGSGSYEATLLASNAVGDSGSEATITGIELADAETVAAVTEEDDEIDLSAAQNASSGTSVAGLVVLGAIVAAGGGLLAWWWLRRRKAETVPAELPTP